MVIPLISGSAGVYIRENDQSQEVIGVSTSVGAIVFGSKKGDLSPQIITSNSLFQKQYGKSDITYGYGHISAAAFFNQGSQLWCLRIPGEGSKYANSSIGYLLQELSLLDAPGDIYPFTGPGSLSGYDKDPITVYESQLSAPLSSGAILTATLTVNGYLVNAGPVNFNTDQPTTLNNFVTALNYSLGVLSAVLNLNANGAFIPKAVLVNQGFGVILFLAPEGLDIQISLSIANNSPAAFFPVHNANLLNIYSQNPGDWGNDIGYNITDIDTGVYQRSQILFGQYLAPGQTYEFNMIIGGVPVSTTPFTVPSGMSSDNAIADLGALFNNIIPVNNNTGLGSVVIEYPNGFGSNYARIIKFIAPLAGPNYIQLQSVTVNGGPAQQVYFSETLAGVASDETFTLNVFQRGNEKYPIASYKGALTSKLDGYGQQLFIEEVVNVSSKKSSDIRVVVNKNLVAQGARIDPHLASSFALVRYLGGGDDGAVPTNGHISAGWDIFRDTEKYPMNILINAGYTDASVQQNIADVATNRKDCIAIIDVPSDMQDPQSARIWRTQQSNLNTSYASICSPDILILDNDTDQRIYVPRSGYDAARYVYTDNNFATWFAPAGYDRGKLPQALGFRYDYSKADRDILDGVQINCGKHALDGSGYLIFGENTSQVTPTLLSSVAVRRMLIFAENSIARSLDRNIFDQNSEQLGFTIRKRLQRFLQPIKDGQGIKDFFISCNPTKDPGYFADVGQLNVVVFIVPIRPVKIIVLDAVITPSSVSFQEFVANGVI